MSNQNKKYYLGFAKITCIGPNKFNLIYKSFSSIEQAWNAPITKLEEIGFSKKCIAEILRIRNEINLDAELEKHEQEKIQILTLEDKEYPKLLKEIYDPPFAIFYKGTLPKNNDFLTAIVGSRKYTQYGKQATQEIASELASCGIVIVSGLALGIDAIAHQSALDSNAKTIGVLGCGIDKASIYPARNKILSDKIIATGGCILSEHTIGTIPYKSNFPQRNRIISGLCLGTLVVEAAEKSGALITARSALEQNREVFAVPGPINSETSQGTNNLIKMGARPVTCAEDILDCLNLKQAIDYSSAREINPDSPQEAAILKHLSQEPIHIDELIRQTQIPSQDVNSTLTIMEMKGKVRNLGSMKYALAR